MNEELYRTLLDSAVDLGADELAPLRDTARRHQVTVLTELNERARESSRATITLLVNQDA